MAGVGEILEENARLRALLQSREDELRVQMEAHERDRAEWGQKEELQKQMVEALRRRAEQLARALELIDLKRSGPASERFVPDEQDVLPFTSEITPPPRAPAREDTEAEAEDAEPEGQGKGKGAGKPGRGKPKRPSLKDREDLKHRSVNCRKPGDASCARCGGKLDVIGQTVSYRVEWVPGHFVIDDVIRDKCACRACPQEGVLTVPGPYALDRAMCGNGLLARVLVDKFADHIPLHRQARRMAREGFEADTTTMAGWVLQVAKLLAIVAKAVRRQILESAVLLADGSGFPVQDGGDGKLRKGRLWAGTDLRQVLFAFTATKHGEHAAELFRDFCGKLVLFDGGTEFNQVVRERGLKRGGCWSHLRRRFFEARKHHPREAALALSTIRDLFLLERDLQGRPPDEVRAMRQAQAKPLVDGLYIWFREQSTVTRPESTLGDALGYALRQEQAMRLFLEHGELPLHNNTTELMIRQPVVGRKNWLFARSEGGAEAACVIYTLIGSCMLQAVDPYEYLVDTLGRLPDYPANRVHELTPMAWRLAREGRALDAPPGAH